MTPQEQALEVIYKERDFLGKSGLTSGLKLAYVISAEHIPVIIQALQAQADYSTVPMPPNKEYAEKMYLVAELWLKDNGCLTTQSEKDRVMKLMVKALKSAKEELWDCHSHCDPETSNICEAVAWRDCRDALAEYEKLGVES